jgi:purine-binding chemotaxis protein CheW
MAAVIKDLAQVNADLQEQKERVENVDFKMVTFSLAGKDYGVDIMNVKEIAKADKFTYVPNAASFVRGVYNLRGDIIPIIDLRNFFHLPIQHKNEGQENMLILHINEQVYGTIVDKIDKVVGINHEQIQPPHPIFGDINIKFISGVVEKQGALYIILDVIRIFTVNEDDKGKNRGTAAVADAGEYFVPAPAVSGEGGDKPKTGATSVLGFIQEGLAALRRFFVTEVNSSWLEKRFSEWSIGKAGEELQLKSIPEAEDFISGFMSPCTGDFWSDSYAAMVKKALPEFGSPTINVWNLGCGKGYETYSFACILRTRYPQARIKIWANDNDIMAISQAPNMTFDLEVLPEYCRAFMIRGKSGYAFDKVIKDSIVFEYHDILHENTVPDLEIILARDILSFLPQTDQERIVQTFSEKLKNRGVAIVGRNEELSGVMWNRMADDPLAAYLHSE